MIDPPIWTREQLDADRLTAISIFRKVRMEGPLEDYLEAFDKYQGYIEELLETTVDLAQLDGEWSGKNKTSRLGCNEAINFLATKWVCHASDGFTKRIGITDKRRDITKQDSRLWEIWDFTDEFG